MAVERNSYLLIFMHDRHSQIAKCLDASNASSFMKSSAMTLPFQLRSYSPFSKLLYALS